ncbi:Protein ArsC [Mucilaginibacter polytrichastri]|uniref:Protein ArsC n=2 Tax=Mucilaginibacter polytrichastri TaxID=1302689 RepID=A0A1Q5ZUH0_9SPHI|nr:Protein ArsC [Mucilaginibacter polytrichastri]
MLLKIKMMIKKNILVLCTGNSCRSQLAEGYLRYFAGDKANIYSAGIETHGVNPKAIQVMAQDHINISGHTSNHVDEYLTIHFDHVITVCDNANEACPFFPGNVKRFHENFPDPAKATGTDEEIMDEFRRVRDLIKVYAANFVKENL